MCGNCGLDVFEQAKISPMYKSNLKVKKNNESK